jgi:heat shock protein HtpX
MTITTTQLLTRVRTWALVAGLTALIVALGVLIGGVFLWLFAALAVGMNILGYFYSDRVALRVARAQPLAEADAAEVYESVRQLALRAAIPMPRLFVMPGEQPNAFATGRSPAHAAVAVTEGLLLSLSHRQVRGVLAHELSHIKNHDILVSSIAATIAGAIAAIANIMQLSFLFGADEEDNPLGGLGALAAMILAPLGAMLLQLGISRQREYLADATAARLLGEAAPLADALQELERAHAPALAVSPVTAPMYIVNPLAGGRLTALLATHPPLSERIRRLRAYDRAAGTRQQPAHTRAARAA